MEGGIPNTHSGKRIDDDYETRLLLILAANNESFVLMQFHRDFLVRRADERYLYRLAMVKRLKLTRVNSYPKSQSIP